MNKIEIKESGLISSWMPGVKTMTAAAAFGILAISALGSVYLACTSFDTIFQPNNISFRGDELATIVSTAIPPLMTAVFSAKKLELPILSVPAFNQTQNLQHTVENTGLQKWVIDFLNEDNTTALNFSQYNSFEVLNTLKDFEYKNSDARQAVSPEHTKRSYILREECLLRDDTKMTSCDAFTRLSTPKLCASTDKIISEKQWHPYRLRFQRQIIAMKYKENLEMSKRLNDSTPSVYALRGNSASGKTRIIRGDSLFKKILNEKGEPIGTINPDLIKNDLIKVTTLGTHEKVHRESSALSSRLIKKIVKEMSVNSIIIDKRLDENQDVNEVISIALKIGATANFIDVDVPLEHSCLGILTRPIDGDDPTVPFDAVANGYLGIRQNRISLIQKIETDPAVGFYKLYSKGVLIAEKRKGDKLDIISGKEIEFDLITSNRNNLYDEIYDTGSRILEKSYIKDILQERPYLAGIEKFEGLSIKAALDAHAKVNAHLPPSSVGKKMVHPANRHLSIEERA